MGSTVTKEQMPNYQQLNNHGFYISLSLLELKTEGSKGRMGRVGEEGILKL